MKNSMTKNAETTRKRNSTFAINTTSSAGRPIKTKKNTAEGLRELFIDGLKDIYWAEKALVKALPKMAKYATGVRLITAVEKHTTVTQGHVQKVESVFELLGKKAVAKKCEAMEGLLREADGILQSTEAGPVRDAGIIAAAQKIEHYEIATYGTLCAFASTLGESGVINLLEEILNEEKLADTKLTEIAYNDINFEAAEGNVSKRKLNT